MATRTEKGALTDPDPATWNFPRPGHRPDGVFILTGASEAEIADTISLRLAPVRGNGWRILHEELGRVRVTYTAAHDGSRQTIETPVRARFSQSATDVAASRDNAVLEAVV